jgi:hypothetical protein
LIFEYLHPGLNRRVEEPFNSRLNYGYAVLRNAINGSKMSVLAGIEVMVNSLKNVISNGGESKVLLPTIHPIEEVSVITE